MIEFSRKFFQKNYTLTENGMLIGNVTHGFARKTYSATLKQSAYTFTSNSGFNHKFSVSSNTENNLSEITINFWNKKATIALKNGTVYEWKRLNFFDGVWQISQGDKQILKYAESFRKGVITGDTSKDLLVLSGLVVKDYFHFLLLIVALLLPNLLRVSEQIYHLFSSKI